MTSNYLIRKIIIFIPIKLYYYNQDGNINTGNDSTEDDGDDDDDDDDKNEKEEEKKGQQEK